MECFIIPKIIFQQIKSFKINRMKFNKYKNIMRNKKASIAPTFNLKKNHK